MGLIGQTLELRTEEEEGSLRWVKVTRQQGMRHRPPCHRVPFLISEFKGVLESIASHSQSGPDGTQGLSSWPVLTRVPCSWGKNKMLVKSMDNLNITWESSFDVLGLGHESPTPNISEYMSVVWEEAWRPWRGCCKMFAWWHHTARPRVWEHVTVGTAVVLSGEAGQTARLTV